LLLRDLQRVRPLHERVHAPVTPVVADRRVAFGRGYRQSHARLRPVHEHAIAVPDLRHELGDAARARVAPRFEAGAIAAEQVVDARRIRELLQLQVEQFARFTTCREVRRAGGRQCDRRESCQQPDEQRAADRIHDDPRA
jgi:hypothetical protein